MSEQIKRLYDEIPFDANRPYEKGGWRNLPEIVHDECNVKGFFGDYRWLSNFGQAQIQLDGVAYPSVEIAYQAAKHAPEDRNYFFNCTSRDSIAYNRQNPPTFYTEEEWETVKVEVMRFLLEQKFNPELNPQNAQRLQETGNKYLEETNWWGDTFWGKDLNDNGKNTLGQLIMEIRANSSDSQPS